MAIDALALYILSKVSGGWGGKEIVDPNVTTDGMADKDYTDTDLSDPETPFTDLEDKWWTIDTSREIMEPGVGGGCLVGYKKVYGNKAGAKCLPILYNLETQPTNTTQEPEYMSQNQYMAENPGASWNDYQDYLTGN